MRVTLSSKLFLLLLVSLVAVLVPALIMTYIYAGETALRADKQDFTSTIQRVEENINAGFIHLNESKVSSVVRGREALRLAARRFVSLRERLLAEPDPAARRVLLDMQRTQKTEYAAGGILIDAFLLQALETAPQTDLGLTPDLTDIKGRTLAETLAPLPASGDFAIYRLPAHGLMLLYFLPARDGVVFSALSIQALENEAENSTRTLILGIRERFAALRLYPGGFAALLDQKGNTLAERGAFDEEATAAFAPLLDQARSHGRAQAVLLLRRGPDGPEEILAVAGFSRPFGWSTILAAPLREISAASRALLIQIILQSLGLGLLVIVAGLFLLKHTMRPLRLVLRKIGLLPELDFSSPQAGVDLARDLPLERQDEVGDLARAFAAMGEQLQRNIRARMEAAGARDRMQGELHAARDIQLGILPPPELSPNMHGLASYALLEPAREIGGDLYDFFTVPDGRQAFVIGDVSGKGVPAALFMAITVTLARFTLNGGDDPGRAMGRINELLQAHNPSAMFVTLFLGLYDPRTGRMEYANGGHNLPCLAGGGGPVRFLEGRSGPLVGVMPGLCYTVFSHELQKGEVCLLYTDGVTEAVNTGEDLYGEDRLLSLLREKGGLSPRELLTDIFDDIQFFRGDAPPFDDITMLAFARR
ncbi:MAG: SpoIIE family protein phosphatase [Deltaproteobacteria bacterium]|jgi:sigma-B regulation protein RsbU (phosphoserine phosphatase)|nr:SpoIIE family protein phosphatase [Deltaproteobacteria bacterium]